MRQSSMWSMNRRIFWAFLLIMSAAGSLSWAAEVERDPVTMSVVVVNPSVDKVQTIPVRIDLPAEITPTDVLETGDLKLEYDDERALYFVHREDVQLRPKETRVFSVKMRDLWFVPEAKIADLREYTQVLLGKLRRSEYFEAAKRLSKLIFEQLDAISAMQKDETLSRKSRIGAYRRNMQTIGQIREDLNRMEKLLSFAGGPPVPNMLEESALRSDAPSTTTTWGVIFLIVIFLGLLGGQFFFTWQRKMQKGPQDLGPLHDVYSPPASRQQQDTTDGKSAGGTRSGTGMAA